MEIVRLTFQKDKYDGGRQMAITLDMQEQFSLRTSDIPGLLEKMEFALPGIFPHRSNPLAHNCGGDFTDTPEHSLRDEISGSTNIPHLFEHVLLHLLSRRTLSCRGLCGQKSADMEHGRSACWYIVIDCPSELEGIIAAGIGFELVNAWLHGKTVSPDSATVLANIHERVEQMLGPISVTCTDELRL